MGGIEGRASGEATAEFAGRAERDRHLPPEHFREAPGGLRLSSIGLGTYLGNPDAATDRAVEEAVTVCLSSGRVNVLDTAINYRFQRAERSVGRAVRRLVDRGLISRGAVFVSTKAGYLAPDGESDLPAQRWVEQELLAPGHLRAEDVVDDSHAMSPEYLDDQFERSRRNLGLDSVDLLYLHNAPDAQLPSVGAEEFGSRLEAAFQWAERQRDEGRLGAYGLATWESLRVPAGNPRHFDLEVAVRIARKVGGDSHGFRYVQFPFNLAMTEAAVAATQTVGGRRCTVFEAAHRLAMGTFTSVPLVQGQLARSGPTREGLTAAQTALQFARSAPHTLAALVGQKRAAHLSENLEVASRPPWSADAFSSMLG
jgi:aryl-alcohol dehydrogenase-like predicted oxidoreductase